MAKRKVKKEKRLYKPVQSTQQNIPIRDFVNGVVVTKDNKYVKVIEVLPAPFFLKKISEQNKISDAFFSMFKAAPPQLHFKSVAIQADLSHQIESVENNIREEKNPACRQMGEEYKETLENGQRYGVTRRFFVSFPFSGKTTGLNKAELPEIMYNINNDARRLISGINNCGNEVVEPDPDNPNEANAKLFYMLYNRANFLEEPFSKHIEKKYQEYFQTYENGNFYMPPTDYIAPKKMSFMNSKYMVIDDTYYSFLYIPSSGYNPCVVAGWLDNFINSFIGVDVDVFIDRVPKEMVSNAIKRSISHSKVTLSETTDVTDSFESASTKLGSGYYLKNGLSSGQDYYYVSTIITVTGRSPEEVDYKKDELKKTARQMDITLHENIYECEQTFNAVLPTGTFDPNLMEKMKRNVITDGAASFYPFTTFQMIDSEGLYVADDSNGSPAIIDMFNRKRFNNPHIFICGETGAGKTITLLLMALRARIKRMPVFILAPEKQDEFRRVCDAIGGQFVSIGAGSPQRINIMEIFKKDESGQELKRLIDGGDPYENGSYLEEKIATLIEFLQLHITDITIEEKQLLDEAIVRAYARKGITKDNNSLWADAAHTRYKQMPILEDLVNELASRPETVRLSRITKLLTTGTGSHFNGQTNVNVDNEFFVIGLEHNTKDMLGLSIYMAMDYCWSKIKEDRTKNKMLFIDEWWKLAFNPIAADKSLEISKIARAYSCAMVLATQQMSDILAVENGKYGNAVLNNCATKILMSMKEKDVYAVKEMVGLTNSECEKILKFKAGQGLLIAGDSRMTLQFNPSETEKLLTFTDNETLMKYAEMKRQEEYRQKEEQIRKEQERQREMNAQRQKANPPIQSQQGPQAVRTQTQTSVQAGVPQPQSQVQGTQNPQPRQEQKPQNSNGQLFENTQRQPVTKQQNSPLKAENIQNPKAGTVQNPNSKPVNGTVPKGEQNQKPQSQKVSDVSLNGQRQERTQPQKPQQNQKPQSTEKQTNISAEGVLGFDEWLKSMNIEPLVSNENTIDGGKNNL